MQQHITFMTRALEIAKLGQASVSPNPMVGCVIVKNNKIIGEGYHHKAGMPHAEINALTNCNKSPTGATMYVTLEPCSHTGRTPPCVNAIIKAGIKTIVIATQDPNPKVASLDLLREAGIEVITGVMQAEAKSLNVIFNHYIKTKKPYVIAKWAMSLDGKTVTPQYDSKQISNLDAQRDVHDLRRRVDAILVGANTALGDNPRLTVRFGNNLIQPTRIILTANTIIPSHLKMFAEPGKTIIAHGNTAKSITNHEDTIEIRKTNNRLDLNDLLTQLGERGITSLLVEGGMTTLNHFFEDDLVNEVIVYVAPSIIGKLDHKRSLNHFSFKQIGNNLKLTASGDPQYV